MNTDLDLDELFHLAILASRNGDHEKSILYLKRGCELENSVRFLYMLGAEYAEIGMYERAEEYLTKVVELDDSLPEARFQLGLLLAMNASMDKASDVWSGLDCLGEDHFLRLFKNAILIADKGDYDEAIGVMSKGMGLNSSNQALNDDMKRLVLHWQTQSNDSLESSTEEGADGNFFLSAYQDRH